MRKTASDNKQRTTLATFRRDQAKKIFLARLAETNRIGFASQAAGITRMTPYNWIRSGYITQQELEECREVYESLLELSLSMGHFGQRSKHPYTSSRLLLARAKAVLPEFGGRKRGIVSYDTSKWTPDEKAAVYHLIRETHAKHR